MISKEIKKAIWEAGNNDTFVEDILLQEANNTVKNEKISKKDFKEALDIYRDGFMGKNEPPKRDTADICEEAHSLTRKECKEKGIVLDLSGEFGDTEYTHEAQVIFNKHFDRIENKYTECNDCKNEDNDEAKPLNCGNELCINHIDN